MPEKSYKKKHMTSFQLIIMGFAGVILLGTVLLMLPFSSAEKVITPFHEALFYSHFGGMCYRSCGKGHWKLLVPGRPDDHSCTHTNRWAWSSDCGCVCFPLPKENIPHAKKHHAGCNFKAPKVGGIVRLTRFILRGTFLIEAAGTVLLLPVFMGDYGKKGIWMSVFHSISAFCNAGFDILGTDSSMFPSLTGYSGNILINLVIMLLIITGGIGFLTWDDIYTKQN